MVSSVPSVPKRSTKPGEDTLPPSNTTSDFQAKSPSSIDKPPFDPDQPEPRWDDMDWWVNYEEFMQKIGVIQNQHKQVPIQPTWALAMRPLVYCKPTDVRVVWLGRESGASPLAHPDGLAYSDSGIRDSFSSLSGPSKAIVTMYKNDPLTKNKTLKHVCLRHWSHQGVLLWNTLPLSLQSQPLQFLWTNIDAMAVSILKLVRYANPNALVLIPDNLPERYKNTVKGLGLNFILLPGLYDLMGDDSVQFKEYAGMNLFSQVNVYLKKNGMREVDWTIK